MANDYTPPDLVTSGAKQDTPDGAAMMGSLKQGSVPADMMGMLRGGMSAGGVYGAALASGANPGGANPVLQQAHQGNQDQMAQIEMMERVQERKSKAALAKNKASWEVLSGIVNDPNTSRDTLKAMVPQYQKSAKEYLGVDIPASAIDRAVPKEKREQMLQDLHGGMEPALLKRMYPWLKDQDIPQYQAMLKNPEVLRQIKSKTPDELKMDAMMLKGKEADLFLQKNPWAKDPTLAIYAQSEHQRLHGKHYMDGTPESQQQVAEIAKYKMLQQELDKENRQFAHQSALSAQSASQQSALAEQRDIRTEKRTLEREGRADERKKELAHQKKLQALVVSKTFVAQVEAMIPTMEKEGFLPKNGGQYENMRAKAARFASPNDPTWRQWLDLQGNFIGFARSVQNDIGPRAMAAFQQAVRVSEQPPTAEGLKKIVRQMREQIAASETGDVQEVAGTSPLAKPKSALDAFPEKKQ